MIIRNALVFLPDKTFARTDVRFDEALRAVGAGETGGETMDGEGLYLLPGFVDVHTHGAVGRDHSDGDGAGLEAMSRYYARRGVTSVCPTTMTLDENTLTRAMAALRAFRRPEDGARYLGVNLEGPFLGRAKCGAQNTAFLHRPDAALFRRLNEASGGAVRLVTVAPEEPGALDFIREVSRECRVSIGHTAADYDTAMRGFEAGATHATHLFNGMPPLHHRDPGPVGAALDAGASAELICDGQHIHPSVVRAVRTLFGDRLVIISDSLRCAGMPEGEYELGGQPVFMKDGLARLRDGTIAGSATNLLEELRNVVRFGFPLEDAVWSVTAAPARAAGASDVGRIAPGCRADLVLLDRELNLGEVFIGGRPVLSPTDRSV